MVLLNSFLATTRIWRHVGNFVLLRNRNRTAQEPYGMATQISKSPVLLTPSKEIKVETQPNESFDYSSSIVQSLSTMSPLSVEENATKKELRTNKSESELCGFRKRAAEWSEVVIPKKPKSRPFIVSVEGNIGSGKSTFLNYFSTFKGVATFQEPVDLWTNIGGHNLLSKLYEDPRRWSFLFQTYVQLTRLAIHLQNDSSKSVKLIERSLQNNRYCFVESGRDSGELDDAEYAVLSEFFDFIEKNMEIDVDLIVYLRSSPEVVYKRMLNRGRSEEVEVSLEYLKRLHHYYEEWLIHHKPRKPPAPVLVINADVNMDEIKGEYQYNLPWILGKKMLDSLGNQSVTC